MVGGGIMDNIRCSHRAGETLSSYNCVGSFHSIFPEQGLTTGMRLSDHLVTMGPSLPLVLATTGATIRAASSTECYKVLSVSQSAVRRAPSLDQPQYVSGGSSVVQLLTTLTRCIDLSPTT